MAAPASLDWLGLWGTLYLVYVLGSFLVLAGTSGGR